MSQNFLDILSPSYIGSRVIQLALSNPAALQDVEVVIDWSEADQYGGIVLPAMVMVQAPNPEDFRRLVFTRALPKSFLFTPKERGLYLVVAREIFHNQLHGSLEIEVSGEQSSGA